MTSAGLTTFLAIWAGLSTLLNLLLAVWNYRLASQRAMADLPYIASEIHHGQRILLSGPNASIWQIDYIRIAKPRRAQFLTQHLEYDDEGNVSVGNVSRAGRKLDGGHHWLLAESRSWPVEISVTISLKSAARTKRSLKARLIR